jgi:hypothetical protein
LLAAGRNERRKRACVRACVADFHADFPPFLFSPPLETWSGPRIFFSELLEPPAGLLLSSLLFRSIWLWGTWQWQRERAGARTSSKEVTTRALVVPVTFVFASNTTTTTTTKRERETAPRGTTNEPSLFAQFVWQPTNSISLSKQISHQQTVNSTFLSEKISTSHQPNEQAAVLLAC